METLIQESDAPEEVNNNNFLLALRIQTLGDLYRDWNKMDLCEKEYIRAQTLIGNCFGEDSMAIIPYNGNLVGVYSAKEKKDGRVKTIVEKNLQIAEKTLGE